MLQSMSFNFALHIFVTLRYLYPDVALYSFSVCNVVLEVFHALLEQGRGGGTGCGGERGTGARWGAEEG